MNNSTESLIISEASGNSTTPSIGLIDILEMCFFSIAIFGAFPTHLYILWHIVTGKGSGITSEFFNLNLSVCVIGICLNCLLFILDLCCLQFKFLNLPMILFGFIITGYPLFQCLISVERYLAVVHPVTFLKYKPLRYRVICSGVSWIITIGSCFCSFFMLNSSKKELVSRFIAVQFLFFFSVQLFLLVAILRALKQSGPGDRKKEEENNAKKRAFHLILIITISMAFTYVPYLITCVVTLLKQDMIEVLWLISLICFVLAGFVHPVLYLWRL